MAATDFQWGGYPVSGGDIPCKNTDGSNDLKAGDAVTIDSSNAIAGAQPIVGVKRSTTDDVSIGAAVEAIPKGATGRIRVYGVAVMAAGSANSGVITAGTNVQADATGQVKTQAAGKPQIGIAFSTTAAQGDPVLVLLDRGKNA